MEPFMTNAEKQLFQKYLSHATHYFEFGSGGSTTWALNFQNIQSVTTVENDPIFCNKLQNHEKLTLFEIDTGEVKDCGHPINQSKLLNWKNYWNAWNLKINEPDLVLIDGRFRVCCALTVALSCKKDTFILFHDFENRKQYHSILLFFDIIEKVDTLVILKVKENNDMESIKRCILLFNDKSD